MGWRAALTAACLSLAAPASAAKLGLEWGGNVWKPSNDDLDQDRAYTVAALAGHGDVASASAAIAFGAFVEGRDSLRCGLSAGAGMLPATTSRLTFRGFIPDDSWQTVKLSGLEVPVSVYLKGIGERWGLQVGGGMTY